MALSEALFLGNEPKSWVRIGLTTDRVGSDSMHNMVAISSMRFKHEIISSAMAIYVSVLRSFSLTELISLLMRVEYTAGCISAKKGKRKVQGVPQSQTAALPRPQEEEETDKSKQAQIEQTYEKH